MMNKRAYTLSIEHNPCDAGDYSYQFKVYDPIGNCIFQHGWITHEMASALVGAWQAAIEHFGGNIYRGGE